MRERAGNLWAFHDAGAWVAITTNGIVRRDGACVMGRGVAREAAERDAELPYRLGAAITRSGNHVHIFPERRLLSFPVKAHWRDPADPALIRRSAGELMRHLHGYNLACVRPADRIEAIYVVRPGCGNGRLRWADVKPMLAPLLSDAIIIVERAHA